MFIKELQLYVNYLKTDIDNNHQDLNDKRLKYYTRFKTQLLAGIEYYQSLSKEIFAGHLMEELEKFTAGLDASKDLLYKTLDSDVLLTT
jgi:hypothetical protein